MNYDTDINRENYELCIMIPISIGRIMHYKLCIMNYAL